MKDEVYRYLNKAEHALEVMGDYSSDCAWEAGIDEGIVVCPISYSTQEWESSLIQQSYFAKSVRRDGVYL